VGGSVEEAVETGAGGEVGDFEVDVGDGEADLGGEGDGKPWRGEGLPGAIVGAAAEVETEAGAVEGGLLGGGRGAVRGARGFGEELVGELKDAGHGDSPGCSARSGRRLMEEECTRGAIWRPGLMRDL
jgi:hypothetical protein